MLSHIKSFIEITGEFTRFQFAVLASLKNIGKRRNMILEQMEKIGYDSLLLITITAGFTGLVTAVQASYLTNGYIPPNLIGVLVGKSTMIELAPVLTALVLAGKVGASIAAEIGTMKVSEQLDSLLSMAIEPADYLYMPKVVAGCIMVPILTIYADFIGILSAFGLSVLKYRINGYTFFLEMKNYFMPSNLWGGLVKAFFFGLFITMIGCFAGSRTEGGAQGVGRVATATVVHASIAILILDFVVASVLIGGY
ncbi:MAG: ABC transporter permease [Candidatus Cloacimonetes bacterium]|nr:ABC transporter permease [Candidatus Cloacimonadota bacterium]